MTSVAMCFSCIIGCWSFSTENVDFVGDRFNVCWINTGTITTEMVKFEAARNFANNERVSKAMSHVYYFRTDAEGSVSFWGFTPCPHPASPQLRAMSGDRPIFINLLQEPIFNRSAPKYAIQRIAVAVPFKVMRGAHTSSHNWLCTNATRFQRC